MSESLSTSLETFAKSGLLESMDVFPIRMGFGICFTLSYCKKDLLAMALSH